MVDPLSRPEDTGDVDAEALIIIPASLSDGARSQGF